MQIIRTAILILSIGVIDGNVRGEIGSEVSHTEDSLSNYFSAISDFYGLAERKMLSDKKLTFPPEQLPIAYYLSQKAKVTCDSVIGLKSAGRTWMEITYYYGMGADIYYVFVKTVSGPPYGKAIGPYKNRRKQEWRYIKLSDDDVVNLVNLKFLSAYYSCSPEKIMKMRTSGKSFMDINNELNNRLIDNPIRKEKSLKGSVNPIPPSAASKSRNTR